MAMFKDNSPCKSPDHHKVISFDNLTKGKADIVFLNGWHDKFRSKKKKTKKRAKRKINTIYLKAAKKITMYLVITLVILPLMDKNTS